MNINVGVIYDEKTLAPLRVIFPHHGLDIDAFPLGVGEAIVVMNPTEIAMAAIALKVGRGPASR